MADKEAERIKFETEMLNDRHYCRPYWGWFSEPCVGEPAAGTGSLGRNRNARYTWTHRGSVVAAALHSATH